MDKQLGVCGNLLAPHSLLLAIAAVNFSLHEHEQQLTDMPSVSADKPTGRPPESNNRTVFQTKKTKQNELNLMCNLVAQTSGRSIEETAQGKWCDTHRSQTDQSGLGGKALAVAGRG